MPYLSRRTAQGMIAAIAIFTWSTTANAVSAWRIDESDTSHTATSGRSGEETRTLDFSSNYPNYLTSIQVTQRGINYIGSTCRVDIGGETLAGRDHQETRDECQSAYDEFQTEMASVRASNGHAIRAVAVCTSGTRANVTGIKIRTLEISDGSTNAVFNRPNEVDVGEMSDCNEWQEFVICPSRNVAIGLRLRFRYEPAQSSGNWQSHRLVGLALICAPLVRRN